MHTRNIGKLFKSPFPFVSRVSPPGGKMIENYSQEMNLKNTWTLITKCHETIGYNVGGTWATSQCFVKTLHEKY